MCEIGIGGFFHVIVALCSDFGLALQMARMVGPQQVVRAQSPFP